MIVDRLWQQLADPAEHAATRRVLADALLAAGDPQGEYIALAAAAEGVVEGAVEGAEGAVDRAAWDATLQAHARSWLGAYARVTQRAFWARGFPTRLELNAAHLDDGELEVLLADPRFATVEELVTGHAKAPFYAAIVARARHASLRRIELKGLATLAAFEGTAARIEHVAVATWHDRGTLDDLLATRILPACERFPTLTSIAVNVEQRDAVFASRMFPRLRTITLGPDVGYAVAYWPAMLPHQELVIAAPRLPGVGRAVPGEIRLRRGPDGVEVTIRGQRALDTLTETVQALPRDVVRLEVHGPRYPLLTQVEAVCARRGIAFAHVVDVPASAPRYGFVVLTASAPA
ncbi:MAG: hypothetical protein NT062_10485 [Proteobacteria bacterium]|nr:hypothetical protein [Pseudomonadota bacterium]